jgi:uncharacterized protein YbaA (DUF1428 family)
MAYVDGFLLVVPTRKLAQYRRIAAQAGRIWKKYGALEYRECVGDDLRVRHKVRGFRTAAAAKSGEAVVFSWIVYKSKGHRNAVNKKVMKDPWIAESMAGQPMPFDMSRMAHGGFKVIVDM